MTNIRIHTKTIAVFREFRPFFITRTICFGSLALVCSIIGLASERAGWFVPVVLLTLWLLREIRSYSLNAVIIRGLTLYIRRGVWVATEHAVPLWRETPIWRTSLLGAALDFTTVVIRTDEGYVGMKYVEHAEELRALVDTIQRSLASRG